MPKFRFDRDSLPAPPAAAVDYLSKLLAEDQSFGDNRIESHYVQLLVAVVPVDLRLNPIGDAFLGLVKKLSTQRITLLHTRAIALGGVVIEVGAYPMDRIQLFCQVTSCEPSGRFYEIGGLLVHRITD
jgi:hypothetical protein